MSTSLATPMDDPLSQRLSQFFDGLLDEEPKKNKKSKKDVAKKDSHENGCEVNESKLKKKKKKKQRELTAKTKQCENVPLDDDPHPEETDSKKIKRHKKDTKNTGKVKAKSKSVKLSEGNNNSTTQDKGQTDDGFKIVSSIPEDDSDISDAFESCSDYDEDDVEDDQNTTSSRRQTEDGFKIVTDIPPDDSDISDAFEDEEDEFVNASLSTQQRDIKKPLMQIMDDFGIDDKVLEERKDKVTVQPLKLTKKQMKLKKTQPNTLTQAAKRKKQKEVLVLDYAKKRGANKKRKLEDEKQEEVEVPAEDPKAETMDEKQLKQVRYDVFKLGMTGFHKEKREESRVALAIKLGAKPPRNKAVNYKKLIEMKKEEKKKEAAEREMKLKLGMKVPKPFKKKDKPPVKAAASQIGRYKHGVQVISRRDIAKVNKSR